MPAHKFLPLFVSAALLVSAIPLSAQTGWKPAEQIKTYAISGGSGGALYQSIGERGPTAVSDACGARSSRW